MFTLTKQQKVKKLLKHNYTLSVKLDKKLNSLVHFEDNLSKLEFNDYNIQAEKIAFIYDELKHTYKNFNTIDNYSDLEWKLNKPIQSEGEIFIVTNNINDIDIQRRTNTILEEQCTYYNFINCNKLYRHAKLYSTDLLLRGIENKIQHDLIQQATQTFITAQYTFSIYAIAFMLLDELKPYNNVLLYTKNIVPTPLLAELAKLSKTNIIIKE